MLSALNVLSVYCNTPAAEAKPGPLQSLLDLMLTTYRSHDRLRGDLPKWGFLSCGENTPAVCLHVSFSLDKMSPINAT